MKPPAFNAKKGKPPKVKNLGGTAKRVLAYFGHYKGYFFVVVACLIITAIVSVLGSTLIKSALETVIPNQPLTSDFVTIVIIMGILYLLGVVSSLIHSQLMTRISNGTMARLRTEMFAKMQQLPIKFFDTHTHGELMSYYTNDVDALREMISQSVPQLISSITVLVGSFAALIYLCPVLCIFVVIMLVTMGLILKALGKRSGKSFGRRQASVAKVNGYIEETMAGQKVVKVFNHENKCLDEFDALNEDLCEVSIKANIYANIMMPIMGNLSFVFYALVAAVGGIIAARGITVGGNLLVNAFSLGSFLIIIRTFSMHVNQLSMQSNNVLMALAAAERIFSLMDEQPGVDDGEVTLINVDENGNECEAKTGHWAWKTENGIVPLKGDVRFNQVNFAYEENKPVLKNVSLYAKPGQKVAFVGSTGAGKTTITNLINRFYDIEDGEILYDGINVKKIQKADLRRSLGMVLQDTHLFRGTVRENLRFGKLDATDEEIIAGAKQAGAHSFIQNLPEGYDTVLELDGTNLSQGQRQLLSIARAAIADPPVLILDEATSSIDTRTEKIIQEGMDKLMEGRTVFVIAHRLSTVANADAIMVLEKGEIIERGDHNVLIAQKGRYFELYTGKAELI